MWRSNKTAVDGRFSIPELQSAPVTVTMLNLPLSFNKGFRKLSCVIFLMPVRL
jgi:hypothetical protein